MKILGTPAMPTAERITRPSGRVAAEAAGVVHRDARRLVDHEKALVAMQQPHWRCRHARLLAHDDVLQLVSVVERVLRLHGLPIEQQAPARQALHSTLCAFKLTGLHAHFVLGFKDPWGIWLDLACLLTTAALWLFAVRTHVAEQAGALGAVDQRADAAVRDRPAHERAGRRVAQRDVGRAALGGNRVSERGVCGQRGTVVAAAWTVLHAVPNGGSK